MLSRQLVPDPRRGTQACRSCVPTVCAPLRKSWSRPGTRGLRDAANAAAPALSENYEYVLH